MKHIMRLDPMPFEKIKSGYKTIELRLNDEKRQKVSVGDEILFVSNTSGEELSVRVINLHRFPTFKELYSSLSLDKCGYLPEELPFAAPEDMEKYYPIEMQEKYGVLGIEIERV